MRTLSERIRVATRRARSFYVARCHIAGEPIRGVVGYSHGIVFVLIGNDANRRSQGPAEGFAAAAAETRTGE